MSQTPSVIRESSAVLCPHAAVVECHDGRVMFALRQRAQQPANTPGHGSGVSPNAGIGGGLLLRYGLVDRGYHRQTLIRVIDGISP